MASSYGQSGSSGSGGLSRKAAKVFKGFTELSENERRSLLRILTQYHDGDYYTKRLLNERFTQIDVGPVSDSGCPCCGR